MTLGPVTIRCASKVEALLAAHEEARSFIEGPTLEVEAKFVAAEQKEGKRPPRPVAV